MFELTPDEWVAIRLSLRIALVATIVALPFGIAIAWLLARKNFWGKSLLDGWRPSPQARSSTRAPDWIR